MMLRLLICSIPTKLGALTITSSRSFISKQPVHFAHHQIAWYLFLSFLQGFHAGTRVHGPKARSGENYEGIRQVREVPAKTKSFNYLHTYFMRRTQSGKISYADFAEIMGEKVLQRDPEEEMKKVNSIM